MSSLNKLKINIYVDGPNIKSLSKLNNLRVVKGFTTNPTLISKMNISYSKYARKFLKIVKKKVPLLRLLLMIEKICSKKL